MTELIRRLRSSVLLSKVNLNVMFVILLSILMIFLALTSASAQGSLACDNRVQISLNQECEAMITPRILLEASNIDESLYTVEVMDSNDKLIEGNPLITGDHAGNTYSVRITAIATGTHCWGYIDVEEKHPPLFEYCFGDTIRTDSINNIVDTLILTCNQLDSLTRLVEPLTIDQCTSDGDTIVGYTDTWSDRPCFSDDYIDLITREWKATDDQGNMSTCIQIIAVEKPDFSLTIWPPHYNGDTLGGHELELYCDYVLDTLYTIDTSFTIDAASPMDTIFTYDTLISKIDIVNGDSTIFLENGNPSPETTGYPSGVECRHLQNTYKDTKIVLCGGSFKLIRHWTLLDWCNSETARNAQLIHVLDTAAPIVICTIDSIHAVTDPWRCHGDIDTLPPPDSIFDCSLTTYTVAYKMKDDSGDPYTGAITDGVVKNIDGSYGIMNLPQDTTWIIYTITDECGYSTQCYKEVVVHDQDPPTAICESHTIVSLDYYGKAKVAAAVFDDHSYDNCSISHFKVKRLGETIFQDSLLFTCVDIGNSPVEVVMRAFDSSGNHGDCLVSIKVQNKLVDVLVECPGDRTLNCDHSTHPDSTGYPLLDESCITAIVDWVDEEASDFRCGEGSIKRTWTITDAQGFVQECVQYLHITDLDPFTEYDIRWPEHKDIDGCSYSDTDPENTGRPIFYNEDCVDLSVGYQDQEFNIPGACKKIVREWSVIDWCRYDANFPENRSKWEYYQNIKLHNDIAPVFLEGCDTFDALTNVNCEAEITLSATATDDCTSNLDLYYTWAIDTDYTGSFIPNDTGLGRSFDRVLPIGTHAVKWFAKDECGNESSCFQIVNVLDGTTPVPICLGAISLSLGTEGWIEIWASDFIKELSGGCGYTDQTGYTYSFSPDAHMPNRKIDCAHFYYYNIGQGKTYVEELQVYLRDGDTVLDFCQVVLRVTDNFDLCPDFEAPSASISGLITNEDMEGLGDFEMMLMKMSDTSEVMSKTIESGAYSFPDVEMYSDYTLSPSTDDSDVNGVSTLDLVLIQQHILGLRSLDSPYKHIAADVNESGSISAVDLIQLRRLILGQDEHFQSTQSWRFVDRQYDLNENDPLGIIPEKKSITNFTHDEVELDFIAVKMGDVNNSASINLRQTEVRSSAQYDLVMQDNEFENAELVEVPIIASEDIMIRGFQFAVSIDEDLVSFEKAVSGAIDISEFNYNIKEEKLSFSWNDEQIFSVDNGQALFTLVFKTKTKGQIANAVDLNIRALNPELILEDYSVQSIKLEFERKDFSPIDFHVYQNNPNPFSDVTELRFILPDDARAVVSVYNLNGSLVKQIDQDFVKGENKINIDLSDQSAGGVFYVNVVSGANSSTLKMVKL